MLYPLKFYPILKEKIWGGNKLNKVLNKSSTKGNIGESWEISTIGEDVSIVSNGKFQGESIISLIETYKEELLGKEVYDKYGCQFPLLFKFIDANKDLSIQLHPDNKLAKERHGSFGKTEMWYTVQSDSDSKLIVGFNQTVSEEKYISYLKQEKITELLNFIKVEKGDSFFINAGTIHAIGSGVLVAEIQQTSDITYRVYDWNRKDNKGNTRELHTELALEAIKYESLDNQKLRYNKNKDFSELISCEFFTTNYIKTQSELKRDLNNIDSFKVYMCVEGCGEIQAGNYKVRIIKGETILIPASISKIEICSKNIELLEVYIK